MTYAVAMYDRDPDVDPIVIQVADESEALGHAADAWTTGKYVLVEAYGPGLDDADHDGIPDSILIARHGDARAA